MRIAEPSDATALSEVREDLKAAGKRRKPSDPGFARRHDIADPDRLRCVLALDDDGAVAGFQSLEIATAANPYGTPVGWGIIGTHIRPAYARQGVGRRLFSWSLDAARQAGLPAIEAFIGAENAAAIAYYEALGFVTYRPVEGVQCKRL